MKRNITTRQHSDRSPRVAAKKAPKKSAKPAKAGKKAKPAKKAKEKKPKRLDTGYCALIRKLLLGQKHTIGEARAEVMKQFPGKTEKSVTRVMMNLAKRQRKADQSEIKWLPSAVTGTGYMARIDELLREGKLTTRQIGEKVVEEFEGKTVESAKRVIRARLKRLKGKGEKLNVPLEAALREKIHAEEAKKAPKKKDDKKKSKEIAKAKKAADGKRAAAKKPKGSKAASRGKETHPVEGVTVRDNT